MDEALKCFLHEVSEVIVPSKAYRVSITEDKMRLAWHHIALPRYLAYGLTVYHQVIEPQPQNHIRMSARLRQGESCYLKKKLMEDKGLPQRG
jgi:hypothetical protein